MFSSRPIQAVSQCEEVKVIAVPVVSVNMMKPVMKEFI